MRARATAPRQTLSPASEGFHGKSVPDLLLTSSMPGTRATSAACTKPTWPGKSEGAFGSCLQFSRNYATSTELASAPTPVGETLKDRDDAHQACFQLKDRCSALQMEKRPVHKHCCSQTLCNGTFSEYASSPPPPPRRLLPPPPLLLPHRHQTTTTTTATTTPTPTPTPTPAPRGLGLGFRGCFRVWG